MMVASAKSPYSETIAAVAGKTAITAKKAMPPAVANIRSAEIE
jgi:hypothetical protein